MKNAMRSIGILLVALPPTACLHSDELDNYPEDVISCRTNDDCFSEEMHCGGVVSEPVSELGDCSGGSGFVNTDTGETVNTAPDAPNAVFQCVGGVRYFPYCTPKDEIVCDGQRCPVDPPHGCARVLNGNGLLAIPLARCVRADNMEGVFQEDGSCPETDCGVDLSCIVPLALPSHEGIGGHKGCVATDAIASPP
ncbi:MAG: hypothetical protein V3T05_11185 [Myxococcota bacterium]